MRPKKFSDLIGQESITQKILKHVKNREVTAWMFTGEKGSGKTSIARIMALSYQCTHAKFGSPCKACRKNASKFDIIEIDAARLRKAEELEQCMSAVDLYPKHGSNKRVYILDELQMASKEAQSMMYKTFEESPASTIFIVCTTDPDDIKEALRSRCLEYAMKSLDEAGIKALVKRILDSLGKSEEVSAFRLAEALWENGITSARLITMAVEKRLAGATDDEAAQVGMSSSFNATAVIKSIVKGEWPSVRDELAKASKEDAYAIRKVIASYLKAILLDSDDLDDRTQAVATAIQKLAFVGDKGTVLSVTSAICFELCRIFKKYSH